MPPGSPLPQTVISPSAIQTILRGLWVYFALDDRVHSDPGGIVPGEPLSFVWDVYTLLPGQPSAIDATWAAAQASITFDGDTVWPASSGRSGRIPAAALPRDFYRIHSTNTLQISVPAPAGVAGGPLVETLQLFVLPEPVDGSWFSWTNAPPSSLRWKQDSYTLGGTIENRSQWSTLTFTPVLHEDPVNQEPPLTLPHGYGAPTGSASFPVPPGGSVSIDWAAINQAWAPWFDRVFLFPNFSQLSKGFRYTARFTAVDEYANPYPVPTSPPGNPFVSSVTVDVEVDVADWKVNDVRAALAAQTAAMTLTLIAAFSGPLAGGFLIAAGTAEGVAQGFAVAALDPPEPDNDFTEAVPLPPPRQSPKLAAVKQLAPLARLLAGVQVVLAGQGVLSQTYGKLLGALLAGDPKSAQIQADHYGTVVSQIAGTNADLVDQIDDAAKVIETVEVDAAALAKTVATWQKKGMPAAIATQLSKGGLAKASLANLQKASGNPKLIQQAATAKPVDLLGQLVGLVGEVTIAIRDEAPRVMALTNRLDAKKKLTLADITLLGAPKH